MKIRQMMSLAISFHSGGAMLRSVSCLASLFFSICFIPNSSAQSPNPQAVVDDYVKAWNSHDMRAFDRLFTDDAIFVRFAGSRIEGHGNIVKEFKEIHTTWAKDVSIYQSATKVRALSSDSAVILEDLGHLEHGKQVPGVDIALLVVVVKQPNGWKISVGEIAHPSSVRS
jgi:uncharacterized protein (TIGR02246 family)